jgi:hypothetical protein
MIGRYLGQCRIPVLCRFSDTGNDDLTTRSDGRRPKSAKARNRGRYARSAVPLAQLWGFERRACRVSASARREVERLRKMRRREFITLFGRSSGASLGRPPMAIGSTTLSSELVGVARQVEQGLPKAGLVGVHRAEVCWAIQRRRHGEVEHPGGLNVDDQLELGRLHDRYTSARLAP